MWELLESVTVAELMEMEEAERFDPCGMERVELAIATLTSTVQGLLGKAEPPGKIAPDWGGLREKARQEASSKVDYLERRQGAL